MPTEVAATSCFRAIASGFRLRPARSTPGQSDGCSGDGRRARAAVGLDYVAIQNHGSLAQAFMSTTERSCGQSAAESHAYARQSCPVHFLEESASKSRAAAWSIPRHPAAPELRSQPGRLVQSWRSQHTRVAQRDKDEPSASGQSWCECERAKLERSSAAGTKKGKLDVLCMERLYGTASKRGLNPLRAFSPRTGNC